MLVTELLKTGVREPLTIAAQASLLEAARLMVERRVDFLLVVAAPGGIAGTLSVHDIVEVLAKDGANLAERPVATVMRRGVATCSPDQSLNQLRKTMTERRLRYMPIVENQRVVGLVGIGDILLHLFREARLEEEHLQDYFLGLGYH